jgi:hypothetical protein
VKYGRKLGVSFAAESPPVAEMRVAYRELVVPVLEGSSGMATRSSMKGVENVRDVAPATPII